ncbi:MAG: hypothetical protein CFE21_07915 [Bacteroidetes bacterium B1(2017)]|nr:MAG: hypothetical protein CFE21_07915 [Bacteroidetes bacterium B1(2017)]
MVSDYGAGSPYTAAMLGSALNLMPDAKVIEISHHIPAYDLSQAAFLLRSVYLNFPLGSFHLICIDTSLALHKQFLFAEVNGHYFLAADNGVFSLLFDIEPTKIYRILVDKDCINDLFPEKNVFLPLLAKFVQKGDLKGLAEPGKIETIKQGIQALVEGNGIKGTIMMVDGYQNAITNVHKSLFEKIGANRNFKLFYWSKHSISKIHQHFNQGSAGDDVLLFNENGYLMIAIHRGKGAQLLGLKPGSKVVIEFESSEEN